MTKDQLINAIVSAHKLMDDICRDGSATDSEIDNICANIERWEAELDRLRERGGAK